MNVQQADPRINFLISALLALIFLSKVSLKSFLPIPFEYSVLIYQYGIHPYVNVALTLLFGVPLFLIQFKPVHNLSRKYQAFVVIVVLTLSIQTFLQIYFVNSQDSITAQILALLFAIYTVFLFGVMIPILWVRLQLLKTLHTWSAFFVVLSVVLFCLGLSGSLFKGGRFIGVFKHIPHMVTCATLCFILTVEKIKNQKNICRIIFSVFLLVCSFWCIYLTGTRSSLGAILLAAGFSFYFSQRHHGWLLKILFSFFLITGLTFFGWDIADYGRALAKGETALAGRQAQNGFESRWEEVLRGYQMFKDNPWLGKGLAAKFSSGHEIEFNKYNAMKDPHNIFISAAVVGGLPLMALAAVGVLMCFVGGIRALLNLNSEAQVIAIYLLTHLPILLIYHIHLSIGGMADRIYWMMFGLLAMVV